MKESNNVTLVFHYLENGDKHVEVEQAMTLYLQTEDKYLTKNEIPVGHKLCLITNRDNAISKKIEGKSYDRICTYMDNNITCDSFNSYMEFLSKMKEDTYGVTQIYCLIDWDNIMKCQRNGKPFLLQHFIEDLKRFEDIEFVVFKHEGYSLEYCKFIDTDPIILRDTLHKDYEWVGSFIQIYRDDDIYSYIDSSRDIKRIYYTMDKKDNFCIYKPLLKALTSQPSILTSIKRDKPISSTVIIRDVNRETTRWESDLHVSVSLINKTCTYSIDQLIGSYNTRISNNEFIDSLFKYVGYILISKSDMESRKDDMKHILDLIAPYFETLVSNDEEYIQFKNKEIK